MTDEKRKQLLLSALYVVLIVLFTGLGLWFRGHPLFTGQGLRTKTVSAEPVSTYEPYAQTTVSSAAATNAAVITAEPAVAMPRFYTTARAAVFTFSGLGSEEELQAVLKALETTGSHATFFVTASDLENRSEQVEEIYRAGHSFGIAVPATESSTEKQLLEQLQEEAEILRSRYGAYYEIFVRQAYTTGSTVLLRAASAGGFRVLTELKEAVPERVSRMTDVDEVVAEVFKDNEGMLQRGEIVHFQMGLFQYSDTMLGELVKKVATEKSCYPIVSANELAGMTSSLYDYPLSDQQILSDVRDKIYPGHLAGMTDSEIFNVIRKGYIGIDWVVYTNFLPGFTEWQSTHLDTKGVVPNDQNYVFLTFDDWGTDGTVDGILRVLEKHNATGTFFVRTEYVPNNPNLLRAIAEGGHTIGAHTHRHLQLSNEVSPILYKELTEEQRQELEDDIVLCYDTMQHIVGDLRDAGGKPSLSLLFRQPTLAAGKNGLQTVFDCGYTHAIAGYYTSSDYKAESAARLAADLKARIKPGAIIVLHFSDEAKYTAEALDILLTEYESRGSKYQFVGLNKVLS